MQIEKNDLQITFISEKNSHFNWIPQSRYVLMGIGNKC